MMSQIEKLVYEIEMRIQIDKEDFMHDINQHEFKMDGQDKCRGPRGMFQEATQSDGLGGAKKPIWVKGRRSQSHGELYVEECHYSSEKVTCESMLDFIHMQLKIQSHQLKAGMLKELKMLMPSQY